MIVNTDQIKQFLNIEIGYVDDDLLLDSLNHQAHTQVQHDIGRCLDVCDKYIATIKMQILFLISTWYSNREIVGVKSNEIPKTYDYLINSARSY